MSCLYFREEKTEGSQREGGRGQGKLQALDRQALDHQDPGPPGLGDLRVLGHLTCPVLQLPDLKDAEAVQKFFLEEIQQGEELLAQGKACVGVSRWR